MSDGAMTSAPACAQTRACSQRTLDGHVVFDDSGCVDDAVLAVRCVGIECRVGDDAELRQLGLERGDGARNQAVGVDRLIAAFGA